MINSKYYKLFFVLFLSFFYFNIYILSINALNNNSESLITTGYFKKKYIIDFEILLNDKIEKNFQQYILNKHKYYTNNIILFNDLLYNQLSNKINVFQKKNIQKKMTNVLVPYGKKIVILNGNISLINGELINLSKSTLIKPNSYLLKNNIYISYEKSILQSNSSNIILFLSN